MYLPNSPYTRLNVSSHSRKMAGVHTGQFHLLSFDCDKWHRRSCWFQDHHHVLATSEY